MVEPQIFIMSDATHDLGVNIANQLGGELLGCTERCTLATRAGGGAAGALREAFQKGVPIVAIMAAGAVLRILAPLLADKMNEPPVVCVSEDGASIVPLLGGHHGANELAREIAAVTGGHAAVTTAGDTKLGIALDQPPAGYVLANPQDAKTVMATLVAGGTAKLSGNCDWLSQSAISFIDEGADVTLVVTDQPLKSMNVKSDNSLIYHPATHVLGMGCERGTGAQEAIGLAEEVIAKAGIACRSIAAVVSLDVKADEAAIHAVAEHLGVDARFFDAATLEAQSPRLANPSDVVFAEVGCHGVAEGAALAASGENSTLVVGKIKSKRATAALARSSEVLSEPIGRQRGRIYVVGIGPGSTDWRSPEVTRMIRASDDLVGYSLYLDLVADISAGKTRHDFDLGREEDRVRHAMELAGEGRDVALICSGDAGIYAMATLVFELLDHGGLSDGAERIAIEISPGISALQGAAARAGAPLGHDFCTISLSDLLTPWHHIQKRVTAAGEGDFVIAFYNPVSKRRRTQLAWAKEKLLEYRPADTPVILASNLGREGEKVRIVPLGELQVDDVDMLTVVVVGSSQSATVKTGDGREWVYTPRGYADKDGTKISKQEAAQ